MVLATVARRRMKVGTPDRPPAVLFVDDGDWDSFLQLSAQLRRAGFTTIRATTLAPGRAVRAFHAIFDYTVVLSSPADSVLLESIVGRYTILDIQATEAVAPFAYAFAEKLGASARVDRWSARPAMIDKFAVGQLLAAAGVRVPETLLTCDVTPAEAIERLGLPLVLKHRVGSAGKGVHVVRTRERLEELIAEPDGEDRFYERYVSGSALRYGCLATEDGIQISSTWLVLRRSGPVAPATAVQFVDRPEVDALGERIVQATGMRGFLNLQFLCDDEGQHWLHDVNPRAWGSFSAFTAMGTDLGREYIHWLQGKPISSARIPGGPGSQVRIFPGALRVGDAESESLPAFASWLWQQRRNFGTSYLLVELVRNRQYLMPRIKGSTSGASLHHQRDLPAVR